ncbi:MAG TPA: heparin lyase I family protein [Hanamia sp.]|nr:heparin lyase I family protein [Hanamia sp.]
MNKCFTLILFILSQNIFAQGRVVNAGKDQIIYLTKITTATLKGFVPKGLTPLWKEVSTDYKSGATIINPHALITKITNLPQGIFCFELSAKGFSKTFRDTVVIKVDNEPPPGILLRSFSDVFDKIYKIVNDRHDTITYISTEATVGNLQYNIYFDRATLSSELINPQKTKFYSILKDGYGWDGTDYTRSEVSYGSGYNLDSNKTYVFEWKGYFPQDFKYYNQKSQAVAIMQIHGNDGNPPPFAFYLSGKDLIIRESSQGNLNGSNASAKIALLKDFVNQTHTIRMTLREGLGSSTQKAFIKVEVDGKQKYFRNTGTVGATMQRDYPKFASLYDYDKAIVDPHLRKRNRRFALVTEAFNIYQVRDSLSKKI